MVYRFFVNAHNEADHLVENLPIDFKKAAMIRFVTPYGQFVTDRFREKWANSGAGRECADPVILKEEEWPKIQREIGLPSNRPTRRTSSSLYRHQDTGPEEQRNHGHNSHNIDIFIQEDGRCQENHVANLRASKMRTKLSMTANRATLRQDWCFHATTINR
ncbi:MAG: hypothetical protein IPH63_16310 [Flavobacteriales bacterium]|nr:hypothetical protein [Flavobacteriales bacterium]